MKKNYKIIPLALMLSSISLYANTTWTTGVYSNDTDISEELSLPNVQSMQVNIKGEVERNYDFIYIYDNNGNELKKFTGKIDKSFVLPNSSIKVTLISDYSIVKSGVTVTVGPVEDIDEGSSLISQRDKEEYLSVINTARLEGRTCGSYGYFPAVDPVAWSDKLYKASYEHSNDLAKSNTFAHDGSGTEFDITGYSKGKKSTFSERITAQGYQWRNISENISAGTSRDTAQEAVDSWIESPGHCKNLMNAQVKDVGMAKVENTESQYTNYWTQNFGLEKN